MNKYISLIVFALPIVLGRVAYADEQINFEKWRESVIQSKFSGVVLVAKDNKIVLKEWFGLANREEKIPFSEKSIFDIGSLTKQFTATAILKLQESNKLSVNDPITKYFDHVPDNKKEITIHHLLTHTAGFKANRAAGSDNAYDIVSKKELITSAFKSKLLSAPGEKYGYSNIGYGLLAIIIEKITEDSYEAYYRDNLFKPAGLTETGYRFPKRNHKRVVINYGADKTFWQSVFFITPESKSVGNPFKHLQLYDGPRFNIEGAGGFSSTLDDLFRWHLALNSNLILSDYSKHELFMPHNISLKTKSKSHYGYGWSISSTEWGTKHAEHNGSNGYSFADIHRFIDDDVFIVLATNDIDVYPQEIMDNLIQIATESMANQPKQ